MDRLEAECHLESSEEHFVECLTALTEEFWMALHRDAHKLVAKVSEFIKIFDWYCVRVEKITCVVEFYGCVFRDRRSTFECDF